MTLKHLFNSIILFYLYNVNKSNLFLVKTPIFNPVATNVQVVQYEFQVKMTRWLVVIDPFPLS